MTRTTHHERSGTALDTKSRLAILSVAASVAILGAATASGCGVLEGQEETEKARQVQEQMENRQHGLEKKLQEGQKSAEEN